MGRYKRRAGRRRTREDGVPVSDAYADSMSEPLRPELEALVADAAGIIEDSSQSADQRARAVLALVVDLLPEEEIENPASLPATESYPLQRGGVGDPVLRARILDGTTGHTRRALEAGIRAAVAIGRDLRREREASRPTGARSPAEIRSAMAGEPFIPTRTREAGTRAPAGGAARSAAEILADIERQRSAEERGHRGPTGPY